jgi:diaminopimelate decarboxylase
MSDAAEQRMPEGFGRDAEGRLLVAGRCAEEWVNEAGDTPLFLYDAALVRARVERFRAAMPAGVALHYAVKANPYRPLVALLSRLVDGLDIASAGELHLAVGAGMPAARISFAGPAKRNAELAAALAAGATIHIESAGELDRVEALACAGGHTARVGLRVNPPFEMRGSGMRMGGGARPFGVDLDQAPPLVARMQRAPFEFLGLHIFAGSQNLDASAIAAAQRETVALAAGLAGDFPMPLVNLGGGFGIPYFPGDRPLDVEAVGRALAATLAARPEVLAHTRFAVELGRWLVGEAGIYLTRVIDRKVSRGRSFLITDGGLHHQLGASGNFGTVVRRNYPLVNASRAPAQPAPFDVAGCLCTPLDRLAADVLLADQSGPGDLIALFLAGAYGLTASPQAFLGHPAPREMLVGC